MILTPYYHSMRIIVDRFIDKGLSPDDARQHVKVVDISMRIDPKVKILIDDADLLLKSLFGSVKCISVDNSVRCPICCGVCKKSRSSFYECINCGTIFEELKNGDLSKIADRE